MMKFDLEDRLINFAVLILEIAESLPDVRGSQHLGGQLVRCGTAPALQYGEAQSAESRRDFVHKMKIALKELRESRICLKIINLKYYKGKEKLKNVLDESNELISIFVKSIETATKNMNSSRN
jgi:four helix bundle protein